MTYLWSDAWLFQAIALASQTHAAALDEVLGAADAVNHAMPTDDELHGALSRLTAGGFIEEVEERFQLTAEVPSELREALAGGLTRGRDAASKYLNAEPWSPQTNVRDPRNQLHYPGLTRERIRSAEQAYRRRWRR
jgi:hypothetical protein